MLKIRALNKESSSDEDGPTIRKEAQEEITLDNYNKALRMLANNEHLAAEHILQTLLEENIPQLESQGGLPKTMSTIKYSCHINLGTIYLKQKNLSAAIEHFLTASELDSTDVTLWFRIGRIALKLDKFRQAAHAFSKGLECSESHWPCLDNLISVLFALRDTINCLMYIGKALILDCNYTKGLAYRKNIYECNPAAKDYYKLYNPDYVYEPNFDVPISKEDEKKYLEEAQKLCDRVNEAEKRLGPKELPTIPLPKPLEEFSWLSVGNVLINLHKYISDNSMSCFVQVDLKRCMSTNGDSSKLIFEDMEVDKNEEEERKETKEETENINCAENVERTEVGEVIERRLSQISDANTPTANDLENITPVQTDNDNDEMDQDIDESEETAEQKNEKKTQSRGTKRRRDLVSELQIWGWHSKRRYSKKGKTEKDFTIEDALTRIIPKYLLPNGISDTKYNPFEDSTNTMDIYIKHIDQEAVSLISPPHSPNHQSHDSYFGSDLEKEEVQKFWTKKRKCCDVVVLIEEFMYIISKFWSLKWPKEFIYVYIEAYNMFREHIDHPRFYFSDIPFEKYQNDALATLLYGELISYNDVHGVNHTKLYYASLYYLETVSTYEDKWGNDYFDYWARVNWLKVNIYRKDNQNILAINSLHLILEILLNENFKGPLNVHLPNCKKYGYIIEPVIQKLLNNLEMIDSLSQLESLYDSQKYAEVAEILKLTFNITNPPTYGRMGRPAQLGMLLHSLWYKDLIECFIWTEECLHEALKHFLKPTTQVDKWEMVLNKCILIMIEIISKETVSVVDSLTPEKRVRLVESLALVCCRQINTENVAKIPLGTVSPWILLHYVLLREEHRRQAKKIVKHVKKDDDKTKSESSQEQTKESDDEMPPSIAVLFSGHEFLGGKSWCLTDQGELLHFILDTVIDRLDTPIFEQLREKIDIHLEQAFFCLYQHPSKKNKVSRHLADHNVNPLPLTWEKAQQVYEFFGPDALPEFDSFKSISISGELEQLLQRISVLVPSECDPQPLVPKVTDFVNGSSDGLPEPVDFPIKTRSMYYLLGDYYFKQSEVVRSYKYFILDLCINPTRLDTWACLALGITSQLEMKLNHCERFKTETEFLDKAQSAQVCFKQSLAMANDHITLWVEYGAFEYMVHSFCSRVLKYESETLSMEKFELFETKKETLLNSSGESFQKALQLHQPEACDTDERWLYHYMLGKISEKRQKEPSVYLQHYLTAAAFLNENKATYPEKINYTNPQHLSIEALEILYRINASILKYVELHDGKPIPDAVGKIFKQCLDASVFPKPGESEKERNVEQTDKGKEPADDDLTAEVRKCVNDIVMHVVKGSERDGNATTTDVIVLDDSDEDRKERRKTVIDMKGNDIQDIMDKMMKETMDKQENENDDSNVTPQEVIVSPEQSVRCEREDRNEKKNLKGSSSERSEENIRKSTEDSSSSSSSSSDSDSSDSDSDNSSSSSSSSSVDNNGNLTESEILNLVDRCVVGLEECIRRLPQNYKALYRLAHLYYHYNKRKDLAKCRQLFLGEYVCRNGSLVSGLFSDRKATNFFNGVWRIPSSEIDRPGSLAAHMGRCVTLLLEILHDLNDHKTLLDICLQLRRVPDADKIYIRHSEREQLSEQALTQCIQCLRKQIKNIDKLPPSSVQKILLDVYRIYQRSQKNLTHKESVFSAMLIEVYKKHVQDKIPENANVLELATKFCQQSKVADKLKKQQTQTFVPRVATAITMTSTPVLPAPVTITPAINPPLKRPGLGRPRGRPPGPKVPGQPKSSRSRNPMLRAQWNSGLDALYTNKHHEELLRQYQLLLTQQMSVGQQMGSLFPQSSQANLLNSMNILQTLQQFSGLNSLMSPFNQLAANLGQYNPGLTNKMSDMYKLPTSLPSTSQVSGLRPDQMRFMNTPTTAPFMNAATSTVTSSSLKSAFPKPSKSTAGVSISKSSNPTFKYPTEFSKPKTKDVTKTTSTSQKDVYKSTKSILKNIEKATATPNILKDRPNISITPVTQPTATVTSAKPVTTPPKTLQEKLADKQKQLKIETSGKEKFQPHNKPIDLGVKNPKSFKPITIPSSINVYPTFSKDSGVSIAQISSKTGDLSISAVRNEPTPKSKANESTSKPTLSVRKLEDLREPKKRTAVDDVIIIE